MKWILIVILSAILALTQGRPGDNLFEIEKQRLVKFPEETFRYEENEKKSSEAKRILEEINKINVALGYVKKHEPSSPSILKSDQFLFPKPSYHPFHSQVNGGALQPSIRNLNIALDTRPNNIKPKDSTKPQLFLYYYVPKSINIPSNDDIDNTKIEAPVKLSTPNKDNFVKQNNPKEINLIDYKVVGDVETSEADKSEHSQTQSPRLRLYFVPRQLKLNEKPKEFMANQKLTRIEKMPTIRPLSKTPTEKTSNIKTTISNSKKIVASSTPTSTTLPPPLPSLKTPFNALFNRPGSIFTGQKVEAKPVLQSVPLSTPQQISQQPPKPQLFSNDDYTWGMESSEEDYPQEIEKHIFSAKRKEMNEVQKEALKESGIIIQRLKVRKGGIAIAGPGGVATAGSGGTAIVGPGGYALTHPRSLTIAGPGAKVIAIPQTTDLKDALLRTNSAIYNRRKRSVNRNSDVISYPYYGGLKGHSLNVQQKEGRVNRVVVLKPHNSEGRNNFDNHFNKIQEAAARLVAIQEIAKQKGTFSQEDNKIYADSLYELGVAAQSLAQLQQTGEIKDFSKLLQGSNTQLKPQISNDTPVKPDTVIPSQSEDNLMPVNQDDPYEDYADSVAVNAPKKDASVAEAKPIGLSIAGEGGVASSKPNAVAIAGREGLAVASPKATAIAGVSPDEAAAFSINVPSRNHIIIKNKEEQSSGLSAREEIKAALNRSVDAAKYDIATERENYDAVSSATLRVTSQAKRKIHKADEANKAAFTNDQDPYVVL